MAFERMAEFDPKRDFKCATFFVFSGIAYERGSPFPKDDVDVRQLRLLYENHKIIFTDARADEEAAFLAPAAIEDLGGGWWAVSVPWEDEPEKMQGHDRAVLRASELRDNGEPADHHGVVIIPGNNGWFTIAAGWLDVPEKVQGEQAAHDRATELRKEGPPDGWVDPETFIASSDNFDATYQIGGEAVDLATIVAGALAASGQDRRTWNAMAPSQRDALIGAEISRRTEASGGAAPADEGKAGTAEPDAGGAAQAEPENRIAALADANNEKQLRDMIAAIDAKRAQADPPLDPLGAKTNHNKTDLARLIVEADGDLPPGGEDGGGGAA